MNINFEYYKIFYMIAKNKNITKAAKELNISQPAISRMLKTMEEQMNIKLFIRKTKGVMLTSEGKELYRLIANEIDGILKAENKFSKIINNKDLKIAIDKTYLNYLIKNNKLYNILKNNSNISFINTNNFDLLNNQLSNNLIDFAFISEPNNYQFDDDIKFKKIEDLHFILVSNSKNDNIYNKPIAIVNNKINESINNYLQSINQKQLKFIILDDYDNILPLIFGGYASGFLIKEFILSDLESKKIFEIPVSKALPSIKMGIIFNKNNKLKIEKLLNIN